MVSSFELAVNKNAIPVRTCGVNKKGVGWKLKHEFAIYKNVQHSLNSVMLSHAHGHIRAIHFTSS